MRSSKNERYVGIDNEGNGGMTVSAKIIRDAWVFGIIPETETCEGWLQQGIDDLWGKVNAEWEKYGFSVGNLPDDLKERFMRIQMAALDKARAEGWEPDMSID